jgi:hypothetical protein
MDQDCRRQQNRGDECRDRQQTSRRDFRACLEARVLVDHQGHVCNVTLAEDLVQPDGNVAFLLERRVLPALVMLAMTAHCFFPRLASTFFRLLPTSFTDFLTAPFETPSLPAS